MIVRDSEGDEAGERTGPPEVSGLPAMLRVRQVGNHRAEEIGGLVRHAVFVLEMLCLPWISPLMRGMTAPEGRRKRGRPRGQATVPQERQKRVAKTRREVIDFFLFI